MNLTPKTPSVRRCAVGAALAVGAAMVTPLVLPASPAFADGTASLTVVETPLTQNFDSLASTGTGSLATGTPVGARFVEAGGSAQTTYTAGTGSANTGDTYSFGATSSTERALGTLRSGSVVPTLGYFFTNDTQQTITSLEVSFTGEQWRLGTAGRADRLDAAIAVGAIDFTGSFSDVNALDFTSPTTTGSTGALDGNAAANRTAVSHTITGLSIAPATSVGLRFADVDASGADDGLAIDDLSITGFAPEGQLKISGFRFAGPDGATDEYVELYNASSTPQSTTGSVLLFAGSGATTGVALPEGSILQPGDHLLVGGTGYSLGAVAAPDLTLPGGTDIPSNGGVRIVGNGDADAVGATTASVQVREGAGLPAPTSTTVQYGFQRLQQSGQPVDSGENAADFLQAGPSSAASPLVGVVTGAPTVRNLSDGRQRNDILRSSLLDPTQSASGANNRTYVAGTEGNPGTLIVRRTITNTSTTETITGARARITALSVQEGTVGTAKLRAVAASGTTVVAGKTVTSLTPETPPTTDGFGGFGTTFILGDLAPGATVDVAFTFAVDAGGSFTFAYDVDGSTQLVESTRWHLKPSTEPRALSGWGPSRK